MTRACNTLLLLSLALIWRAVASAQPASTPPITPQPAPPKAAPAQPGAPAQRPPAAPAPAPVAPLPAKAPATSAAPTSAVPPPVNAPAAPAKAPASSATPAPAKVPTVVATPPAPVPASAPKAAPPAATAAPVPPPPGASSPAAPVPASAPKAAPPAATAAPVPPPGASSPAAPVPEASSPATGTQSAAPAVPATEAAAAAPSAVATEAEREPQPQERKPSFLDPHPAGYLPPIYERDARTHEGFSVRLSAGLGFGATSRKLARDTYKVSGLLGVLSLDIGASVIENLIVYGRLSGFAWNSLLESDSANSGGAYFGLVGAGARYYLMPHNLFASATLGLAATQVLDDLGEAQNAHPGFGLELEIGQDFWIGTPLDRRAIGLALRFGYVTAGAAGTGMRDPKAWNSFAISLLFSAAYN